jgi:Ca-activated chloride channel family protein
MKSIKKITLILVILITNYFFAQERVITGVVTDGTLPLYGAYVVVKGTSQGVQTDSDGKYSIKAKVGEILVYSYIGFVSQQITIGTQTVINIKLHQSTTELNEVIVTGAMGIKRKKDATTSSQKRVSTKELTQSQSPNNVQQLAGKASGLVVNTVANGTNPNTKITLRGNRTLKGNNNALVVIDGKIASTEALSNLPTEQIKTVNVVKGEQAAALYGSQAANGAIIVDTKNNTTQTIVEPNQEDYETFIENAFESPKTAPLSTFSIDVDNASYTNVRRFINNGQKVPKDAVRVEEMVNFFKYTYPQPQNNKPFSINTEYANCPWNSANKLVRIGLQGKILETDNLPASNLVFLIDVSGSMNDMNKLPLVKQSLKVLVDQLRKEDKISIVVYAGAAGLVLPPTSGSEKETIIKALENLNAGGSTAGGAGIQLAYKTAEENFIKGGNNRVILATDGDFNVGASSDADMQNLIEDKRKSGVFLTCLGYGMGNYKDSKMEILADKGNGNYAYIDNIQEANRFLGKEFKGSMFAIAKDVKIQIEFNPAHVKAYRLIGYENRKLRPEDFKNDAIDAGELGSGHTVTALYEIIPSDTKSDFYIETSDLKYTKVEETATKFNDELATIKFRYKKPDGDTSIELVQVIENKSIATELASKDFKFCSAVAWFGLKLRESKLISNAKPEAILQLVKDGIDNDTDGYKAELIRLIEAYKSI